MNIRVLRKVDGRGASVRVRRRGMSVRVRRRGGVNIRARRREGGINRKLKGDYLFHFQFILQSEALLLYYAI